MTNSAARLVFSVSRYDRITPLLTQWHWLKVPERIEFKLAASTSSRVVRRTRHSFQPSGIELFRSLLPDCGTLCYMTSCRHRQYLFSETFENPFLYSLSESPVVPVQWLWHFGHYNRSFLLTYLFTTIFSTEFCSFHPGGTTSGLGSKTLSSDSIMENYV